MVTEEGRVVRSIDTKTNQHVTECKFMYLMHSEVKQTETGNIGLRNRERFIAGPCKEMDGLCSPNPDLSKGFQQSAFKGKVREGCG